MLERLLSLLPPFLQRLLRVPADQRAKEQAEGERLAQLKTDAQFVYDRLSNEHLALDHYEEEVVERLNRIGELGAELMDTYATLRCGPGSTSLRGISP